MSEASNSAAAVLDHSPRILFEEVERIEDLRVLGRRVREHHENTGLLRVRAVNAAREAMNEALLCGAALLQARRLIGPRKGWLAWLEEFCGDMGRETVRRYMEVAAYYSRVGNISEFRGLTELYVFLGLLPEREGRRAAAVAVAFSVAWLGSWMGRLRARLPDPAEVGGWSREDRTSAMEALEPAARLYEALKGGGQDV